jgi:hypothetical protein
MLTELDIINEMIVSTGTAPLTTNDTQHPFYVKADQKLQAVNRKIQSKGWWFNRGPRTLQPDVNGRVILPSNTLHADPVDETDHLTMRGTALYDLNTGTDILNRAVDIVFVELIPITQLPPTAGEYLAARATYEFYRDNDGVMPKLGEYKQSRDEAWIMMKAEHLKNADVNFFRGTSFAQMQRGYRGNRLPPYHR